MRQLLVPTACAVALSLGLAALTGCGSSSGSTMTTPPSVSSFAANPTAITAGASATLTGDFAGGTGVITPGNIAATTGVAITVTPSATTVYTLTVTGSGGTAVTATATITVNAVPTITSFVANPTDISAGGSATLTGVFAGGTGVVTPGNLAITSGTAITVTPSATTTYTLTVTSAANASVTETATVTVVPVPTIASFIATPPTITTGGNATLTGVFAGGTGVVTPGNLAITSGTAITVTPSATTTYTLTVTSGANVTVTGTATVTVVPALTITSFVATPATISTGASATLTGVFAGGTGVITPGDLSATSGTGVTVSPTTTTTYTLTVTPSTGSAVTQTAKVTVDPAPKITSFIASPSTIADGSSTILTGVFSGGTGIITPGSVAATSGVPVTVNPTATTTYTLTVTPPAGTAINQATTVTVTPPPTSTVTVDMSSTGPATTDKILGMNLAAWYDVTNSTNVPAIKTGFATAGIKSVRWPGGSWSDEYNWETNTECGNYANTYDDFTDFVNKLVIPAGLDLALTADYGTGKNCTGPGDPTEAASWAAEAVTLGVPVSHMTVGNEEYGSWEYDNHTLKNNAATYAAAVSGTSGYYQLIKAASPSTLVGVDVNPGNYPAWDPTVLAGAPYDFVEFHYYPEAPGSESDSFIVHQAAQELTTSINTIKSELATAGKSGTPIYVGEIGGPYSDPGKQSWSITQGLYAGQVLGEMMNDGVTRLTWWIGFGNCNGSSGNGSASLYGWQDFGAYNVFSDGPSDTGCPGAGPNGTLSPTARAFQLFSSVAVTGENVLSASVAGDTTDVRAYAATNSGGTALVLFNLSETVSEPITVTLSGQTTASSVSVETYDKAIYDQSQSDVWAAPTTTNLGAQSLPLTLTLTPWSMNVVIIK